MTAMGMLVLSLALACALAAWVLGQLRYGKFGEEGKL